MIEHCASGASITQIHARSCFSTPRCGAMLRVFRFQAQRRLLSKPDLRYGQRLFKQMEFSPQLAELNFDGELPQESPETNVLLKGKGRKSASLQAFRGCFPATHASLADAPFRRFKREQDSLGRRSRLRSINVIGRKRIVSDVPVGSSTQVRELAYYSADSVSDEEEGRDYEQDSTPYFVDLDGWRWRLNRFMQKVNEQEIISKEKKDRRDYEHILALVKQMGLHSQLYGKVVVISKVPLPNYRPDLDERRPQRQVSFASEAQIKVDSLLKEYVYEKKRNSTAMPGDRSSDRDSDSEFSDELLNMNRHDGRLRPGGGRLTGPANENQLEELLKRRNRQIRNKQRGWQESEEGEKMMSFRKTLPAYKEREAILAAVSNNQVLVVSGETGCGKTTQLAQYILESEIEAGRGATCNIICTQPRRISAVSVAERVAAERGEEIGESVGYKVRLEGMRGRNTQLLFCTTGILLRKLMVDAELKGVSHVIVDEIHERGMNEDFLLIVLKDLLPQRPDLRVILMSATLNAELFSSFFNGSPMLHIPGFTYPVQEHFLEDVLEITRHRLTASNQIDDYGQDKMWRTQKQYLSRRRKNQVSTLAEDAMANFEYSETSLWTRTSLACWSPDSLGFNLIERVLCHITGNEKEGAVLVFMTGWEDISALMKQFQNHRVLGDTQRVQLLACHGSMATAEQKLIFGHPPPGVRKIVLATNMAETSITINDVVFVVDCGKAKETSYDALNNTPCLLPSWISQASARQRRGRAGRVMPGVCYRLYPKAVYDAFPEYQLPELLRTPLHSLCLQIKSLKLGSIAEFLSHAPQPPEARAVQNSIELLKTVGALDNNEELTNLGRHLSLLPVEPKVGKMLIMGSIFQCLDPVLTIAAGLAVRDPFLMPMDKKEFAEEARFSFSGNDFSDHIALVRAYEGWQEAMRTGSGADYCWKNFLSMQTLLGMSSLRRQFSNLLREAGFLDSDTAPFNKYSSDRDLVKGVICAGMFPGVVSVYQKTRSTLYKTMEDGQVLLHSSSVNAKELQPYYPWLVFNEKVKTSSVFIRDSTGVSDAMLLLFGGQVQPGGGPGHLLMQGAYLEFFMQPEVATMFSRLREELDNLLHKKLANPEINIYDEGGLLMDAIFKVLRADRCEGSFTFGRKVKKSPALPRISSDQMDVIDTKGLLQTLVQRAGRKIPPVYKTRLVKGHQYESSVEVKGKIFVGEPSASKKQAEKNVSAIALDYITGLSQKGVERMA